MTNTSPITIETIIAAPLEKVWRFWSEPEHITQWAFASDDWEAPFAENDLRTGGKFMTTMAAKDKSVSFDLHGVYTNVVAHAVMEYDMEDGRHVKVAFAEVPEGVKVTETFDPENENPADLQRAGWQAILGNFKKHVESVA